MTRSKSRFFPLPNSLLGEPTEFYQGSCPISGERLLLPRTTLAEDVARKLVATVSLEEGKMLGVLLVRDSDGNLGYAKAFSGQWQGRSELPGWVPPWHTEPMPQSALLELEARKYQLAGFKERLEMHPYPKRRQAWRRRREDLAAAHKMAKELRDRERAEGGRNEALLQEESRAHSRQWRQLRAEENEELELLRIDYEELEHDVREAKEERRQLSRALQAEMHERFADSVASLLGCPLEALFPGGIPTGTGDCCAPKLLAWAAREGYQPVALAELWWGPDSQGGRRSGKFYLACQKRCQPLLGPLLATAQRAPVKVLYRDENLLAVMKPSGLLSVPGRYSWSQDCVLHRLSPEKLWPVHRLDLETSGVLLFARDPKVGALLQKQFAERRVEKVYQALLELAPEVPEGRICEPLAEWPYGEIQTSPLFGSRPPRYRIEANGKSAVTIYRLLDRESQRIELFPLTGRSHQLRVHMAQALGCPIRGDRLYGSGGERLKLHAWRLNFEHPVTKKRLCLEAPVPF